MSTERLQIIIDALFKGKPQIDQATKSVQGLGESATGAGKATEVAGSRFGGMASVLTKLAATGIVYKLGRDFVEFGKQSIQAASAMQEMENKFAVVFQEHAPEVTKNLRTFADEVGRSTSTLMGMAAQMQDTFVPMGFARDQAAAMSEQMVKLAVDISSFNNMSMDEALRALQGTLVGAHRNALQFGVIINENTLKQELYRMGAHDLTGELLEQAKVQARINLIIAGTSDAQGDAARTSESYANRVRAKEAAMGDLSETIGMLLLPALTELVTKQVEYVKELEKGVKLMAGDYKKETVETTKGIVEQADSMDDLIRSAKGLSDAYNSLAYHEKMIASSTVRASIKELASGMAGTADSADEYRAAIEQAFSGQGLAQYHTMLSFLGLTEEQFYEAAQAARRYADGISQAESADRKFLQGQEDLERQFQETKDRLDPLTKSYIDNSSEVAEMMGAYDDLAVKFARSTEKKAEAKRASEELAEAEHAAAEAASRLATESGKMFMEALKGVPIQDDLNAAIIRTGIDAGLSAEKLAILTGQFGDYTDEAIEAAIKSVLIEQKMKELIEKFGEGEISVSQLRAELQRYIDGLDDIPDAVTTNVHTNYTQSGPTPQWPPGITPPTAPGGGERDTPFALGGRVRGGVSGRDSVPALLTPGEIVLPVSATNSMNAAFDFLSNHIPGTNMSSTINIEPGAVVIYQQAGQDGTMIADAVIDQISRRIGQQADSRMRI